MVDMRSDGGVKNFPGRLRSAISGKSIRGFAKECGLSEGVLRNYLRGDTFPTLDRLEAISTAAGVSATWLATGETSSGAGGASFIGESVGDYRPVDERLIGEVIEEVETCVRKAGLDLLPAKKREVVLTAYGLFARSGELDRDVIARLIRLAS